MNDDMSALHKAIEHRGRVNQHVIAALAHLTREQAMCTILAWFDIDDLVNNVLPTLAPGYKEGA